jgi:hypothetical protein
VRMVVFAVCVVMSHCSSSGVRQSAENALSGVGWGGLAGGVRPERRIGRMGRIGWAVSVSRLVERAVQGACVRS